MPRFYESGSVQRYWTINSFKKYCAILVEVCEHESRMIPLLMDGKIVKSGGKELAYELEEKGYDWIKSELV